MMLHFRCQVPGCSFKARNRSDLVYHLGGHPNFRGGQAPHSLLAKPLINAAVERGKYLKSLLERKSQKIERLARELEDLNKGKGMKSYVEYPSCTNCYRTFLFSSDCSYVK